MTFENLRKDDKELAFMYRVRRVCCQTGRSWAALRMGKIETRPSLESAATKLYTHPTVRQNREQMTRCRARGEVRKRQQS
jgi:hypothetical protein